MAEVTLGKRLVHEVIEAGVIPQGEICHGRFTDEEEALGRYYRVLQQQPGLRVTGSLQIRSRYVQVVEPPVAVEPATQKQLRTGVHYEDKAAGGVRP